MELPSQEGDMPIPLNSTYGGGGHGHMIYHDTSISHSHSIPSNDHEITVSSKKMVRYKECLKNHAASMGGTATDGCGEFMPSGEEGTLEALTCSACSCHRNFHRKEVEGEPFSCDNSYHNVTPRMGRNVFLGHHHHKRYAFGYHAGTVGASRAMAPHQMMMSYSMGGSGPSESDERAGGGGVVRPPHAVKKRFRTKFTQEQKEKMLRFAEKIGWKIQKQEEAVVQQFCQEVGVKRRVLKVWMHNNKNTLAKQNLHQSNPQSQSLGADLIIRNKED